MLHIDEWRFALSSTRPPQCQPPNAPQVDRPELGCFHREKPQIASTPRALPQETSHHNHPPTPKSALPSTIIPSSHQNIRPPIRHSVPIRSYPPFRSSFPSLQAAFAAEAVAAILRSRLAFTRASTGLIASTTFCCCSRTCSSRHRLKAAFLAAAAAFCASFLAASSCAAHSAGHFRLWHGTVTVTQGLPCVRCASDGPEAVGLHVIQCLACMVRLQTPELWSGSKK